MAAISVRQERASFVRLLQELVKAMTHSNKALRPQAFPTLLAVVQFTAHLRTTPPMYSLFQRATTIKADNDGINAIKEIYDSLFQSEECNANGFAINFLGENCLLKQR